ncbi:MAG: hypothetical protein IKQ12_02655 [Prevotella sp.]|nr:hypothetical protein [Prevotella sp.]MBR6138456.1 hypothetical protein [Prevotella sp.]
MRQLTKTESLIMVVGALLMAVAAVMYVFAVRKPASWIMLVGTGAFVAMQMRQKYEGTNITIRRLRSIMTVGNIFFVIAALLMVENAYQFLRPVFLKNGVQGDITYITYIFNKWVIALLVGAVIELYTTHRISSELEKEAKKL